MMNCEQIDALDVTERYLSGLLDETEKLSFEEHYFGCAECFERLRIARALRMISTNAERKLWAGFRLPSRLRLAARPIAAFIVIALLGTIYWKWPASKVLTRREDTNNAVHVVERPLIETSSTALNAPLLSLIYPDPPIWSLETQDQTRNQVSQAIAQCRQGNYVAGIKGLSIATKANPDTSRLNLYVGVCYVLANQPDNAINELKQAISPNSPMLAEQAHYYLAGAYLQKNDAVSARKELEFAVTFHGAMESEARAWVGKLDKALDFANLPH